MQTITFHFHYVILEPIAVMAVGVIVLLLCVVLGCCSSLECPTSFSPADNLDALGGASINVYLDENDFDGG